nr:MAG TPA: Protein of unknown function (DUF1653) [Caudoviricetes sp.]
MKMVKIMNNNPMRMIVIGGVYRHFKGFRVTVLNIAIHTETGEQLVVYRCELPDETDVNVVHQVGIYARPLDMFLSEVDHQKYPDVEQKHRFELISIPV